MSRLSLLERALVVYGTRFPNHPRKWWIHDRLRRLCGVAIDRDIAVTRNGLRWILNPSDFGHHSLFWLGTKDTWDVTHLTRLVDLGSVILDIGANFGYYALTLASALHGRCLIHALEPNPANFDRLTRHTAMNGQQAVIQAHRMGVSDHPETVDMRQPSDNAGHTAVAPEGEIKGVQLTTLDAFCGWVGLKQLDLVLLDVEGFEERALKGATKSLARFKPMVFVELFPPVMDRQGSNPEAVARILIEQGYELFAAQRDRLEPISRMPEGDQRVNAFGFHRERLPDSLQRTA